MYCRQQAQPLLRRTAEVLQIAGPDHHTDFRLVHFAISCVLVRLVYLTPTMGCYEIGFSRER